MVRAGASAPQVALAGRWHNVPAGRTCLAPLTLPVWAIKPWFGIGFHCAQLSSVCGLLLYPILDGLARHAWLGPRAAAREKLTNADWTRATLILSQRCVLYGTGPWFLVPGPRA